MAMHLEKCNLENTLAGECFDVMKVIQNGMGIVQDENGKINEQNYMISFAFLLGSIIGGDLENSYGGELKKVISCSSQQVKNLRARVRKENKENGRPDVTVKPDFVIHKSILRENMNNETQKLIIEAKTSNQLNQDHFSWDLFKLYAYIRQLYFNVAIFLIVNEKKSRVDNLIAEYIHQELPTDVPDNCLFFFIQEDAAIEPIAYKLVPD